MSLADDLVALGSEAPSVISGMVRLVRKVGPVLPTVRLVIDDPAFPQVIARIQTLRDIEAAQATKPRPSVPGVPQPPAPPPTGIGLQRALPILDAVIYARRNPWVPWLVGASALLLIGGVGYRLGRRTR